MSRRQQNTCSPLFSRTKWKNYVHSPQRLNGSTIIHSRMITIDSIYADLIFNLDISIKISIFGILENSNIILDTSLNPIISNLIFITNKTINFDSYTLISIFLTSYIDDIVFTISLINISIYFQ